MTHASSLLRGAAALLVTSTLLQASEPASKLLAQEANAALGLQRSHVVRILVDGAPGEPATALVDLGGTPLQVVLEPSSVRGDGFQVLVQGAGGAWPAVEPAPAATFRGAIRGLPGSEVAGSRGQAGGLEALIRMPDGTQWWVQPLAGVVAGAGPLDHVLYADGDHDEDGGLCGVEDLPNPYPAGSLPLKGSGGGAAEGSTLAVAQLACDADFEYFSHWGSVGATQNRIESVINAMNAQYEGQVGITHVITTILVRTSPAQPYTSSDAVTLLNQFRNEWNANQGAIQRDAAQLFTGKEIIGGTIGIAWIGVVCNLSFAYSLVQSDFSGAFACSTDLSAHELGHNWNADHCSCSSNTMNAFITCANSFHAVFTIPEIVAYRNAVGCLGSGGGGGGDPTSVHVASIEPSTVSAGKGSKAARAVVTIRDDQGNPVAGALVSGTFTGDLAGSASGTTGAGGSVTLTTVATSKGKTSFTFCVTGVAAALPYAPGDNAETCDSN